MEDWGVTSVGVGFILAAGKRVGFKGRALVKEALNVDSSKGVIRLVKAILLMTLLFEAMGAALSFIVFVQDYPPLKAMEISIFHSIAAFNNSGFDILGGLQNLIPYQTDVLLNLVTCGLIIFGGLGFLVILDVLKMRSFKKLCLHSKVVITTSVILLAAGTLLLKATEDISWLGAFFQSVSARTAGFSTYPIGEFSNAGLFTLTMLMFIGASPGINGRRYQNQYLFCPVSIREKPYDKKALRSVSPEYTGRRNFQGFYDCVSVFSGSVRRNLSALCIRTGI